MKLSLIVPCYNEAENVELFWEETVKAIKERRKRNETRMASIRLPVWIIEGLKRNAAKGDVKYSEYVIETLARAAV